MCVWVRFLPVSKDGWISFVPFTIDGQSAHCRQFLNNRIDFVVPSLSPSPVAFTGVIYLHLANRHPIQNAQSNRILRTRKKKKGKMGQQDVALRNLRYWWCVKVNSEEMPGRSQRAAGEMTAVSERPENHWPCWWTFGRLPLLFPSRFRS